MRRTATILAALLALAATAPAGAGGLPAETPGGSAAVRLPGSLDAFYPPAAEGPVYLFRMLELETSFSGILVDLAEDDLEGARGTFRDFQGQYGALAEMVPEWRGEYPRAKVAELGAALDAGSKARAMDAFAAVGEVCHRCHLAAMVPAQQRYRWGSRAAVAIEDPLTGASTAYAQFKKLLAANMAGIKVDLRQGQVANARKQFDGFRARFEALGGSCSRCHGEPGRLFVGGEMRKALDALGEAFRRGRPPEGEISALLQKIGRESCSKCHLVHLPAAMAAASSR